MKIRFHLVESDLVTNVFATVQPHVLTISGNEEIYHNLIWTIEQSVDFASPYYLEQFHITAAIDVFNHREMIFQKAVLPSSQFVTFLISNQNILNRDLLSSFVVLLDRLIYIGPFHRPILEFAIASPIAMAFSRSLFMFEDDYEVSMLLGINVSLKVSKEDGPEVVQSVKQIIHALFSRNDEKSQF